MSYTGYAQWATGATLYAKPLPLVTGASWDSDEIAGSENGSTGSYSFASLDENTSYLVYVQAGASPASSDEAVANFKSAEFIAESVKSQLTGGEVTLTQALTANSKTLKITQGDSYSGTDIQWKSKTDDQWQDLTGATLKFGLQYGDTTLEKDCTVDSPTGTQKFSVALTSEETGDLPVMETGAYDVQATFSNGDVRTLVRGKVIVEASYTS